MDINDQYIRLKITNHDNYVTHGVMVMSSSITRVRKESDGVGSAMPSIGKPEALISYLYDNIK